ncbi:hypothetical protein A2U01_0090762, partial [Trifolium medium]|nr:hypothetical protein [Trifolium medium]
CTAPGLGLPKLGAVGSKNQEIRAAFCARLGTPEPGSVGSKCRKC